MEKAQGSIANVLVRKAEAASPLLIQPEKSPSVTFAIVTSTFRFKGREPGPTFDGRSVREPLQEDHVGWEIS